jgi:hypothetical protein
VLQGKTNGVRGPCHHWLELDEADVTQASRRELTRIRNNMSRNGSLKSVLHSRQRQARCSRKVDALVEIGRFFSSRTFHDRYCWYSYFDVGAVCNKL